jgi:hypothetical protein
MIAEMARERELAVPISALTAALLRMLAAQRP